ncbi:MAG: hypothetical protein HY078_11045 [Elusimicrobia bacterium]|nr:hypothetical protein [Elusimicrobiota bacterium]
MAPDRFEWIEGESELPEDVKAAIQQLNRFEKLEIGLAPSPVAGAAPPPAAPPSSAPPPKSMPVRLAEGGAKVPEDAVVCVHCSQSNEKEREICWACHRWIRVKGNREVDGSLEDIVVVLDGITYRSKDKNVPADVRALMEEIRVKSYSPQLLAEWQRRRRKPADSVPIEGLTSQPGEAAGRVVSGNVEVFQGNRVTVIRIDKMVYRSDDPNARPEMMQLFKYIEDKGVTPALMEYLRQFGSKVKYRPSDTVAPTDGDVDFWKNAAPRDLAAPRSLESIESERTLEDAQKRYDVAKAKLPGAIVTIGVLVLWAALRFWLWRN